MLKKFLKYTLYLLLVVMGISVLVYFYFQHMENKEKSLELAYGTEHKWEWENENTRIQVRVVEDLGRSVLRRVHISDGYIIYAYKNDDYTFTTAAIFPVKCEPKTSITTTKKFQDGEPKKLHCNEDGDNLIHQAQWSATESLSSWKENLDGYKIDESFYSWDFDRLDREITLNKAK